MLPVAGVCVGTVQMARGIANQPEAIVQQSKGKVWDEDSREWVDKPDGAIVTVDFARAASQRVAGMFRRAAGDADYYELLEVSKANQLEGVLITASPSSPSSPCISIFLIDEGSCMCFSLMVSSDSI